MITVAMALVEPDSAFTVLLKAYTLDKYYDLLVRAGDRQWKLHRIIVCSQSDFFDKACSGPFQESQTQKIVLDHDEPETVGFMFDYMYTFGYDDYSDDYSKYLDLASNSLLINVKVYALADKYNVQPLKELAKVKFQKALDTQYEHESFPGAIVAVYSTTPSSDRGLRDAVVSQVGSIRSELKTRREFLDVVKSVGDFAVDLLMASWADSGKGKLTLVQ